MTEDNGSPTHATTVKSPGKSSTGSSSKGRSIGDKNYGDKKQRGPSKDRDRIINDNNKRTGVAAGQGSSVAEIKRLRDTAGEAIGSATVGGATTDRYWQAWKKHCKLYNVSSEEAPPANATEMLLTFAVAVREGQHGGGHQVKVQSVSKALCAVAQKYVLDGYHDPRRSSPAQHSLDLPLARLLKKYDDDDPPPQPKLAVPMSTLETIITKYTFSNHHRTVADLCIIAFFYLLRV